MRGWGGNQEHWPLIYFNVTIPQEYLVRFTYVRHDNINKQKETAHQVFFSYGRGRDRTRARALEIARQMKWGYPSPTIMYEQINGNTLDFRFG